MMAKILFHLQSTVGLTWLDFKTSETLFFVDNSIDFVAICIQLQLQTHPG